MDSSTLWSLYHIPNQVQIDELTTAQVQGLVRTISDSEKENWKIWRRGTTSWVDVDVHAEVSTDRSQSSSDQREESRVARRFSRKLKIYVDLNGHIYSSNTVDISASGIAIDPPLKTVPKESFEMQVLNPQTGRSVHMVCQMVEGADEPNRFMITKIPRPGQLEQLLKEEEIDQVGGEPQASSGDQASESDWSKKVSNVSDVEFPTHPDTEIEKTEVVTKTEKYDTESSES